MFLCTVTIYHFFNVVSLFCLIEETVEIPVQARWRAWPLCRRRYWCHGWGFCRHTGSTGSHLITTVNCHSSFRFPLRRFRREPTSLYKPTTQSSSFRLSAFHQPRHTIQTHSSQTPPARFSSTLRTAPHAAPSKYSPFLIVVLVCVLRFNVRN